MKKIALLSRLLPFLALALVLGVLTSTPAFAEEEKVLNLYAWSEYMPQESLDNFTKETGIKVVYSTYDSNEAMYAKLKLLGGKGYDLVIPSTYFIDQMRAEGMLAKIDKIKLPTLVILNPTWLICLLTPKMNTAFLICGVRPGYWLIKNLLTPKL
jgi:Spermidine/putrescine-binding periplasmic protein